ncbi:MAG: peptidylprolyl isomerase [Myxococcales bacterium]|nr:peptidylprolyl isomerase [Myxococcales bacterium]
MGLSTVRPAMPALLAAFLFAAFLLAAFLLVGCSAETPSGTTGGPTSAPPAPTVATEGDLRLQAILLAEATRRIEAISDEDLTSRSTPIRRAAMRALARARDPRAVKALRHGLADEDGEVIAWAAYGLGDVCVGRREETTSALVAAAAALRSRSTVMAQGMISPAVALARALGRCGTLPAEQTLLALARDEGPFRVPAAHALGDVAKTRERLREDTYVGLLSLAEGDATHPPLPEALYPFSRVTHLTPSVVERTQEVALAALDRPGAGRIYAIEALAKVGEGAVERLAAVATDQAFTTEERVAAVQSLAKSPRAGQRALATVVKALAEELTPEAMLTSKTGLLLTALEALTVVKGLEATLGELAASPAAADASSARRRRLSWIRCTAAKILAERNFRDPRLRACDLDVAEADRAADPLAPSIGARAVVQAIGVDGTQLTGDRLKAWTSYAREGERRARQAALAMLVDHAEVKDSAEILLKALESKEPGLVATAAEVLTKRPLRGVKRELQNKDEGAAPAAASLHPGLKQALLDRLVPVGASEDLEALGAVIEAVGALRLEDAKNELLSRCKSPWVTIRDKTAKALAGVMGRGAPTCDQGDPMPPPVELDRLVPRTTTLTFETELGKLSLRLDPHLAPLAVTRAVTLAKNDFYDGMVVHRVVPAFVTQFGSPFADGYGGVPGLPPLPCETSPKPYVAGSVGVALAGRDTGSSQLFVTHRATPRLTGEYAILGQAEGPWDALIDGDVIQDVTVE